MGHCLTDEPRWITMDPEGVFTGTDVVIIPLVVPQGSEECRYKIENTMFNFMCTCDNCIDGLWVQYNLPGRVKKKGVYEGQCSPDDHVRAEFKRVRVRL